MSTVKIAGTERLLRDADAPWIRQAVEASARIGELPCVRVFIQTGNVSMNLQTPNCGGGTGVVAGHRIRRRRKSLGCGTGRA